MRGHSTFERCEVRPAERQVLVDGAPAVLRDSAFHTAESGGRAPSYEASMLEVETWLRACDAEALDRAA